MTATLDEMECESAHSSPTHQDVGIQVVTSTVNAQTQVKPKMTSKGEWAYIYQFSCKKCVLSLFLLKQVFK